MTNTRNPRRAEGNSTLNPALKSTGVNCDPHATLVGSTSTAHIDFIVEAEALGRKFTLTHVQTRCLAGTTACTSFAPPPMERAARR